MSGDLIAMAGTDRYVGGEAGSTGPVHSVGLEADLDSGRARPAAMVAAGPAMAASGRDIGTAADVAGRGSAGDGPGPVPQAVAQMKTTVVITVQAAEHLPPA
jgi:hypothetical protein